MKRMIWRDCCILLLYPENGSSEKQTEMMLICRWSILDKGDDDECCFMLSIHLMGYWADCNFDCQDESFEKNVTWREGDNDELCSNF